MRFGLILLAGLCALPSPLFAAERVFAIGTLRVAEADILDARAQPAIGAEPSVLITLADPVLARVAKMRTAKNDAIIITLDGKPLAALAEPVEGDPTILIPGGTTVAEAEALAKLISGKEPLRDSLEDTP